MNGSEAAPAPHSTKSETVTSAKILTTSDNVLTVCCRGTGLFRTVQEAVDAVPLNNKQRIVIHVLPGIYKQPIYVAKTKNMITLIGDCAESTILTWSNTATSIQHHQTPQVIGTGTFACGTVIVEGEGFIAQGITFENSSPKGSGQAVAIRVTADQCVFYNCRFLGWQDTAYLHFGRQFFKDCYIEGSVDFIFGNATAFLEHCHIHCKSAGYITAQQRRSADETTGYVFLRCIITGTGNGSPYMHLGRPWAPYARVIFAYTWMDACIMPIGWNNWGNSENEKTACFYQNGCTGPGSNISQRARWAKQLKGVEAEQFLSYTFIDQNQSWLTTSEALQVLFVPKPLVA